MEPEVLESDSESDHLELGTMYKNLHDMLVVAAAWKIDEPCKYTVKVAEGAEDFITECTLMVSAIEAMHGNPEHTGPSDINCAFQAAVANYTELNDVFKTMTKEKKRRLTPQNSAE
jgi:hypothetical protein